jgi:mannosyltransferase OCH1-like enzyme
MIPKRIFQTWSPKEVDPVLLNWIERTKAMNPGYRHFLFNDSDREEFILREYPGEIAECYQRLTIGAARADFWRYLVLYKYGGVYIDLDSEIKKPLDMLIRPDDEAIISVEGNPFNYVQWALMFRAGHPLLKRTIDLVVDNIKTNRYPNDISAMTGPVAFARAIGAEVKEKGYSLVHEQVNRNTNERYGTRGESFRVYGIDYGEFFNFSNHEIHKCMLKGKLHWTEEQRLRPLLRDINI